MRKYGAFAEIHDLQTSGLEGDVDFYVEEAKRATPPVLELACGTGHVTIPIAQAGVDVWGVDSSTESLMVATEKAEKLKPFPGKLHFRLADMRDFSLRRRFDLIIIPHRSLLQLLTLEDLERALINIRHNLKDQGRLIFNIFVPDVRGMTSDWSQPRHVRDVTDPYTNRTTVTWELTTYDSFNQVINARYIYDELNAQGEVTKRTYRDMKLRYIYRYEMQLLLKNVGYEIVDLYGGFDRRPFDRSSTEMIWVVRKPGQAAPPLMPTIELPKVS